MSIRLGFDTLIPFSKPGLRNVKTVVEYINNKIQFPYLSFFITISLGRIQRVASFY